MSNSSILEKCCLIGESVAGSPMHFMIERAFANADLDWRFMTFEIDAKRLGEALAGVDALGVSGALLLAGLREAAPGVYGNLSERAKRTGSATCLLRQEGGRLEADDLAGEAALDAVEHHKPVAGLDAVLLGATRIAASLGDALAARGVAHLHIADRNSEAAERLANTLADHHTGVAIRPLPWDEELLDLPEETAVVASSACWPDARDAAVAAAVADSLTEEMVVLDARVSPARTPLLREAEARGARVVDGLELLSRETALAIHGWTGVLVDRAALREAAEEFLGV